MTGNIASLNNKLYSPDRSLQIGSGTLRSGDSPGSNIKNQKEDRVTLSSEARKIDSEYRSDKQNVEVTYQRKKRNLQTQYNQELQALETEYQQEKLVTEIA